MPDTLVCFSSDVADSRALFPHSPLPILCCPRFRSRSRARLVLFLSSPIPFPPRVCMCFYLIAHNHIFRPCHPSHSIPFASVLPRGINNATKTSDQTRQTGHTSAKCSGGSFFRAPRRLSWRSICAWETSKDSSKTSNRCSWRIMSNHSASVTRNGDCCTTKGVSTRDG